LLAGLLVCERAAKMGSTNVRRDLRDVWGAVETEGCTSATSGASWCRSRHRLEDCSLAPDFPQVKDLNQSAAAKWPRICHIGSAAIDNQQLRSNGA